MSQVAIDFETHLIGPDSISPKPVCLSYYNGSQGKVLKGSDMEPFLFSIFNSEDIIIAQNLKFELLVIYKWFPKLRKFIWNKLDKGQLYCTKIYEQLIDCNVDKQLKSYSLDKLVLHYLNINISEDKKDPDAWRLRYHELEDVPLNEWPKKAYDYSMDDSIYAYKIYHCQVKKLILNFSLSVKAEFALNLMAQHGIQVEQKRVQLLEKEIYDILIPSYNYLIDKGFCERQKKDPNKISKKMKLLREYIEENIKEKKYTAKGAIATDSESLKIYNDLNEDEIIKAFLNINKYEKVLSAFTSNLKQADPYIYTEYNAVVDTGRTSSRRSSFYPSVNIQQMPRKVDNVTYDIRNCYIPRDGYFICSIDYNGLELAATANQLYTVYGKSPLRDVVNGGDEPTDLHSKFACKVMSIKEKRIVTYEEFVKNKKLDTYAKYRQMCKPLNLGFPGGIGYDNLRGLLNKEGIYPQFDIIYEQEVNYKKGKRGQELQIPYRYRQMYDNIRVARLSKNKFAIVADEIVQLKKQFFDLYPELEDFLKKRHLQYTTGQYRYVKNEYDEFEKEPMYAYVSHGFKRNFCTYTAFCNGFLMQSPSAAGAKHTVYNIIKRCANDQNINPLAFIHDEIVFEIKKDRIDLVDEMAEMMIDGMQKALPHVRIAVEAECMDMWAKSGGWGTYNYWKNIKDPTLYKI